MNQYITLGLNVLLYAATGDYDVETIFEEDDILSELLPPIAKSGITAPGTKWCGPGNTTLDYDDLGEHEDTDMCCRAHDLCPDILETKSIKHGLNNTSWFPILKCNCEQQFINCLQSVNSRVSNTLGQVYFGSRGQCFDVGYPIVHCTEYRGGVFGKRCIRYNVDKKKPKQWQLYEQPFYSIKRKKKVVDYEDAGD